MCVCEFREGIAKDRRSRLRRVAIRLGVATSTSAPNWARLVLFCRKSRRHSRDDEEQRRHEHGETTTANRSTRFPEETEKKKKKKRVAAVV